MVMVVPLSAGAGEAMAVTTEPLSRDHLKVGFPAAAEPPA